MERNKLSVTQLNNYIKGVFDDELILKNITVFGEVYETGESGGNLYITLKDDGGILRCVRFGGGEKPEIGDTVLVVGSVNYYAKGNRVSFHIRSIEPYGEGAIRREFLKLRERLKNEGLFDNRPPLPKFIKKAGVVTSETGAVIHDLSVVLAKNHAYIEIKLFPVKVQGEGADKQIADAVEKAQSSDCDVLVVARGGGSNSELEPFNTELVARAVSASKIPIISAVGHEVDFTLCDCCSSLRAGTPSIAAENICRINEEYFGAVYSALNRMNAAINGLYSKYLVKTCLDAKRLSGEAAEIYYKSKNKLCSAFSEMQYAAESVFAAKVRKCGKSYSELCVSSDNLTDKKEKDFSELVGKLNGASPLAIIEKGYAKIYKDGVAVGSVKSLKSGDEIDVYMADGTARAKTLSVARKKEDA